MLLLLAIYVTFSSFVIYRADKDYIEAFDGGVRLYISSQALQFWLIVILMRESGSSIIACCQGRRESTKRCLKSHYCCACVDNFALGGLSLWATSALRMDEIRTECTMEPAC